MESTDERTNPQARLVYVTAESEARATALAEAIVSERLAACANLLPHMTSIYRWKGELQHDREVVVLFKTTQDRVERLTQRVVELHSYETPCVLAVPVVGGAQPFLSWIEDQTS